MITVQTPFTNTSENAKSCTQTCNFSKNFFKMPLGVRLYGLLNKICYKNLLSHFLHFPLIHLDDGIAENVNILCRM